MSVSNSNPKIVSDEVAQRVLARAVELDMQHREGTSIAVLRSAAKDLGISDADFDAALREAGNGALTKTPQSPNWFRKLWQFKPRSMIDRLLANVAAFGAFWISLGAASRLIDGSVAPWQFESAVFIAINIGGAALARRLRAQPVAFLLSTTAVAQLAEYVIHLAYGIQSAQGAPVHFAVLLASALGVAATSRRSRDRSQPSAPDAGEDLDTPATTPPSRWSRALTKWRYSEPLEQRAW